MANYRLIKGESTDKALAKTLSKPNMPIALKVMLIKGMLIPSLLYGSELTGMQAAKLVNLKKVLEKAINRVVGKAKFCRSRIYKELNISTI